MTSTQALLGATKSVDVSYVKEAPYYRGETSIVPVMAPSLGNDGAHDGPGEFLRMGVRSGAPGRDRPASIPVRFFLPAVDGAHGKAEAPGHPPDAPAMAQ